MISSPRASSGSLTTTKPMWLTTGAEIVAIMRRTVAARSAIAAGAWQMMGFIVAVILYEGIRRMKERGKTPGRRSRGLLKEKGVD